MCAGCTLAPCWDDGRPGQGWGTMPLGCMPDPREEPRPLPAAMARAPDENAQ
jgi:hypothetical protein